MDELLELWEFPREFDPGKMTEIAQDRLAPPDLRAQLVSGRGDVLTVQVLEGRVTEGVGFRVYVRGRGAFEVMRREVWTGGRELVTLTAWPSAGYPLSNALHPSPLGAQPRRVTLQLGL